MKLGSPTSLLALVPILLGTACAGSPPGAPVAYEGLVVFVQPDRSEVARAFEAEALPAIEALAGEQGVSVRVLDATLGAPEEVGLTPQLVYQNGRGRSVYQGRFDDLGRIGGFLRTAPVLPVSAEPLWREDGLAWDRGRSQLAASLKLTRLTGKLPEEHDEERFHAEASRAFRSGLERFEEVRRLELGSSDRTFYVDLHPYRSEEGELYLSAAVFSQFHCKEPVHVRFDEPFHGPWSERRAVFAAAAAELEEVVARLAASPENGDGFDVVEGRPRDWESLELALPQGSEEGRAALADLDLSVTSWSLAVRDPESPQLLFSFPPPLDANRGEVRAFTGSLELGPGMSLEGARGEVVVETDSVSMGNADLDRALATSSMLHTSKHPEARFALESLRAERSRLSFGEALPVTARGTFEMKGVEVPLEFTTLLEPTLDAELRPRLIVNGAFAIRLEEPFGISGPDGPDPQRDTVRLETRWSMVGEVDG